MSFALKEMKNTKGKKKTHRDQLRLGLRRRQRRQGRSGSASVGKTPNSGGARCVLPRGRGPRRRRERQRAPLLLPVSSRKVGEARVPFGVRHRLGEPPQAHPRRVHDDVVVGGPAGPAPGVGLELGAGDHLVAAGAEDACGRALLVVVFAAAAAGTAVVLLLLVCAAS